MERKRKGEFEKKGGDEKSTRLAYFEGHNRERSD